MARSFERIRSIVRKNRFARKQAGEGGENNGKLEKLVNELEENDEVQEVFTNAD